MAKAKVNPGIAPLPHYAMPDASAPPYKQILEQVQDYEHCFIGSSYFYIRVNDDSCYLCRILYGGGKIFFHELIDHKKHGISDEEILDAAREETEFSTLPGYFLISPHIEQQLRVLFEG